METKVKNSCPFEIKSISEDQDMSFSGYGAVFGNIDAYGDVIVKGAFSETLAQAKTDATNWPALMSQHGGWEPQGLMPLGKWDELSEDDHGLYVKGRFADTQAGVEAYKLLKMGAITGLSIGYTPIEWENRSKPEDPRRTLKKIKLWEVSLVTFPANNKARVLDVKSGSAVDISELAAMVRRNIKAMRSI